jgi:phosphoglycolate phosphatase
VKLPFAPDPLHPYIVDVKYDLVIFDLDGTLIDTRRDITNAANEMLARYGLEAKSVAEVTGYVGDGITRLVERCIGSHRVDIGEAIALFKRSYSAHLMDFTRPYPGIVALLEGLNGVRKAILTNKAYEMSKTITDGLGITGYFELIVGGDSLPRRKPFPDGILHILEETGVGRERSIMVGDGPNDIQTALEAGVRSVYVRWGFSEEKQLRAFKPHHRIDRPEELLSILHG